MPANLQARVAALEQSARPKLGLAERMKAARERLRAMSEAEREANRRARLDRWLAMPEPSPGWRRNLWLAARREAKHRGIEVPADPV